MKYYHSVFKKIERRKVKHRISVFLKILFNSFMYDDKIKLLNFFYRLYMFADRIELAISVCLCAYIFYKIQTVVLSLLACGAYVLLVCTMDGFNRANEVKKEIACLAKFASKTELHKMLFVRWDNNFNLKKILLIALTLNLEAVLLSSFNIYFLLWSVFLLLFFTALSYMFFFYKVCFNSFRKLFLLKKGYIANLYIHEDKRLRQTSKDDHFHNLLLRQAQQAKLLNSEKLTSSLLLLLLCVAFLVHHIAKFHIIYINVFLISLFPSIVNYFCVFFSTSCFNDSSFVNMNYYLMKKHNVRDMLVRTTQKFFLDKTKPHVAIWSMGILSFNEFDWKIAMLLLMNLVHWFVITYIISVGAYSYYKYDFDDLKDGFFSGIMQNPFIDLLISSPLVLIAVLMYIAKTNAAQYILMIGAYTFVLLVLASMMYFVLQKKSSGK